MTTLDDIIQSRPVPREYDRPMVSFLILTCGRAVRQPVILDEAVYWATIQDYPNVEVLVLNDAPGQTLTCDHPRVTVVNWPGRLPDLGTKMNLATALAVGDVCLPNDDDDVSLPWRAEQAVDKLRRHDYWSPGLWVYDHHGRGSRVDGNGYGFNCAAFRRNAMLGNLPPGVDGQDREAAGWAGRNLRCNPGLLTDPREISFVYRWGESLLHLSSELDPAAAYAAYDPGPPGRYEIKPQTRIDYVDLHRRVTGRAKGVAT